MPEGIELIDYNHFAKMKLKVGKIVGVEDIENKDKLYKLSVDLGDSEHRILIAGLKLYYTKEELKGKYVIVVSNLEPKKIGSFVSQGMLLAATEKLESGEEKVSLLQPDKDVAVGSNVY